jgi:hypothetical protein
MQTEKPSRARTEAGERLADLTRGISPKKVDDRTVADLVSLLDIPDDSLHYWVAVALGNLGRRAKIAIPKLERILSEVQCSPAERTSEGGILFALHRMGVKPPPANCGSQKK